MTDLAAIALVPPWPPRLMLAAVRVAITGYRRPPGRHSARPRNYRPSAYLATLGRHL